MTCGLLSASNVELNYHQAMSNQIIDWEIYNPFLNEGYVDKFVLLNHFSRVKFGRSDCFKFSEI